MRKAWFVCILVSLLCALMSPVFAEELPPITATVSLTPTKMAEPGKAAAVIKLSNVTAAGMDVSVYANNQLLFVNPVPNDAAGVTYRVEIDVTDAMLRRGEVSFIARYEIDGAQSTAFSAPITRETPRPELELTRKLSARTALRGQEVTLTYTLRNRGNVKLTSISLSDPPIGTIASGITLEIDEKRIYEQTLNITENIATRPKAAFSASGASTRYSVSAVAATVALVSPALTVELTADATDVVSGDAVKLTCVVTNTGDVPLHKITIADETLGMLDAHSGSLVPGASYTYEREIRIMRDVAFAFVASGRDAGQISVEGRSESVSIAAAAAPSADIDVIAVPDMSALDAPGQVGFTITLTNRSDADIHNVILSEAHSGIVGSFDALTVGVTEVRRVFDIDATRDFAFSARYESSGGERVFLSPITHVVLPIITPMPARASPLPRDSVPTHTPMFTETPEAVPVAIATVAPTSSTAFYAPSRILGIVALVFGCVGLVIVSIVTGQKGRLTRRKKSKQKSAKS